MHPYIHVMGMDVPMFGLMMLLGIGAAILVVLLQCRISRVRSLDPVLCGCFSIAGIMIGAYLLRPVTRLPELIRDWDRFDSFFDVFNFLFGEMVFYGGLIGGALFAFLYCRRYKISFNKITDLYAAAIPAGHVFGRIGCYLGGCCYGMEVSPNNFLSVIYPERTDGLETVAAPAGVPLLPIPLIEAAGNVLIAGIVVLFTRLTRDKPVPGRGIALYGLLYSTQRFILEYFRGDKIRGVYNGLSTSQYISIGLFVLSAAVILLPFLRKKGGARP